MPTLVQPDIVAVFGRTEDFAWSAYDADGEATVLAAGDKIRFKMARKPDDTPLLELVSGSPTVNGSGVTIADLDPASGTVRLAQGDTISFRGDYHYEMNLVDDSETAPPDAIKQFIRGKITFLPSQLGDLGL